MTFKRPELPRFLPEAVEKILFDLLGDPTPIFQRPTVMSIYADPDCSSCHGAGFIYGESMLDGGVNCECMLDTLRLENMERIWKSLAVAPDVPVLRKKPPLLPLIKRDVWITAPVEIFKRHLKAVAFSKGTLWDAKVRTDAMILDSWFGTLKAQGAKIYDVEIEKSILEAIDIRDLVEPPELCIFVLGIKHLPNKEAPNSILEAIGYRRHVGKPTWVVDQPDHPIDRSHHLFYSETLEGWLKHWPHINLTGTGAHVEGAPRIQQPVAATPEDLDDMLEGAQDEPSPPEEEAEEEFEEETSDTTNLLSTLKVESDKPKFGKGRKKSSWGNRK